MIDSSCLLSHDKPNSLFSLQRVYLWYSSYYYFTGERKTEQILKVKEKHLCKSCNKKPGPYIAGEMSCCGQHSPRNQPRSTWEENLPKYSVLLFLIAVIYSREHLRSALPVLRGSGSRLLHLCGERWDGCSGDEHHRKPGPVREEEEGVPHPASLTQVDVQLPFVEDISVLWTARTVACNARVLHLNCRYNLVAVCAFSGHIKHRKLSCDQEIFWAQGATQPRLSQSRCW